MDTHANPRDLDYLRTLRLFQGVPAWTLETVADAVEDVRARKGDTLLEEGSDDGYTYFLLEGQVALESSTGERQEVAATPATAGVPLANLRPRLVSVKALGRTQAFRIPDFAIAAARESAGRAGAGEGGDAGAKRRAVENDIGFLLYRDLREDKPVLPSLPDLALKIRQAIEEKRSDAKLVARWIEQDPAMTAKIVKAANSALYGRREPVETCAAAIVRLGVRATQKLVMTFALREVFQSTKPALTRRMQALWAHSAEVAAIAFVLAQKARGFPHDPEEVLLAGLLHDVGTIAVLHYAQKIPSLAGDERALEETIGHLRGELGALILRTWRFSPELVAAAREAEDWLRKRKGLADIADVVIVAQMHDRLARGGLAGLPPMPEISAVKRVLGRDVTPDTSLGVIKEAQAQIADVRALLEG